MPLKSFERIILFTHAFGRSYPIVEVTFIKPNGQRRVLPLLFDTGASSIIIRPKYHYLFPRSTATEEVGTVGRSKGVNAKATTGKVEFLGKTIDCNVLLMPIKMPPLWAGLLGREVMELFGFGYWQSSGELFVTVTP